MTVYFYDEPRYAGVELRAVYQYLQDRFSNLKVVARGEFVSYWVSRLSPEEQSSALQLLAERMARARVFDVYNPVSEREPLPGEISYELRRITEKEFRTFGILYDGFLVLDTFRELIWKHEAEFGEVHLVFWNQLIGTWDPDDRRYHARVALFGPVSIISIPGVVEAPARDRGYYLARQGVSALGVADPNLLDLVASRLASDGKGWLVHGDERITEALKGYAIQAIVYNFTGEAFCEDPYCRLYNAHWQHELIIAQLASPYEFCEKHLKVLEELRSAGELLKR